MTSRGALGGDQMRAGKTHPTLAAGEGRDNQGVAATGA